MSLYIRCGSNRELLSEIILSMGTTIFGPGNCVNEHIVSILALLIWAEFPLVSIVFRAFSICFFLGGVSFFFPDIGEYQ